MRRNLQVTHSAEDRVPRSRRLARLWPILLAILLVPAGIARTASGEPDYIVGAHYYPNYDITSWDSVELDPWLGPYESADPLVAQEQIEIARAYGIDVMAVVWGGRQDGVDCHHGWCGQAEVNLLNGFMQAPNIDEIKFCIHYDVQWRKQEGWSFHYDFNEPWQFNTFVNDFDYFSETYFTHPSYFTINGRPVVWLLFTQFFRGNVCQAVLEARERARENGFDVYIVADALWWWGWTDPDRGRIRHYDAVTAYNLFFTIPLLNKVAFLDIVKSRDLRTFTDEMRPLYEVWRDVATTTKVSGRDEYVDFQPGIIPRIWRDFEFFHPLFALPLASKSDFIGMAEMARDLSEPALDTDLHIVWVTSWNEWWERTAVEPSRDTGGSYPFGNLGFDLLEAIDEVFGDGPPGVPPVEMTSARIDSGLPTALKAQQASSCELKQ